MSVFLFLAAAAPSISEEHFTSPARERSSHVRFLGRGYSFQEWQAVKDFLNCEYTHGDWIKLSTPSKLYEAPCGLPFAARYEWKFCASAEAHRHNSLFRWKATNCHFAAGDEVAAKGSPQHLSLKDTLRNKKILVVGDSMSEQFTATLVSALFHNNQSLSEKNKAINPECQVLVNGRHNEAPCDDPSRRCYYSNNVTSHNIVIDTIRNEHLKVEDTNSLTKIGARWHAQLGKLNPNLLILNRGAHYVEDDILLRDLRKTFSFLRQFPHVSTIFRSATIGHSDFAEKRLSEPLRSASDADVSERGGIYNNTKILFNWDKFRHQMSLVKSLIDSSFPEIIFIDVYASTARRADLHAVEDGLHYCIPGPIDNWVRLLHTTLQVLEHRGVEHKS